VKKHVVWRYKKPPAKYVQMVSYTHKHESERK
jgi:hypothetical protein